MALFAVSGAIAIPHQAPVPQDVMILTHRLNFTMCQQLIQFANHTCRVALSTNETLKPWDNVLFNAFSEALRTYRMQYAHFFDMENKDVGYTLSVRSKQDAEATPSFLGASRYTVGAIVMLNDDVAGGQLSFPRQKILIDPECGKLVIFPNSYVFPFTMTPVRLGHVYFISTYFH